MVILGIDPGSTRIGFGIISKDLPAQAGREIKLVDYGVIEYFRKPGTNFSDLVFEVTKNLNKIIKKYQPELIGIEKIYFAKNVKTGIEVAQTRGAIILEIAKLGIPIKEFGPSEIKSAITGYGLADKKSVSKMVARLLRVEKIAGFDDASDALAIAMTAAMSD